MNFSSLTTSLISVLKGSDKLSVIREFEESSFYTTEEVFATIGVKAINVQGSYSDSDGANIYHSCKPSYKVTLFGKNTDGAKLISIAEEMFVKLFSSGFDVISIDGGEVSFNTKFNRVQYDFTFTLNARLFNGEVRCALQNKVITLNDNLTFSIDRFEFERARGLNEIASVCNGVILGDGGIKPLTLTLAGNISSENNDVLITLDNIILLGTALDFSCLGVNIPPMVMKKYLFKGDKEAFGYCELLLWSASSSGVAVSE